MNLIEASEMFCNIVSKYNGYFIVGTFVCLILGPVGWFLALGLLGGLGGWCLAATKEE